MPPTPSSTNADRPAPRPGPPLAGAGLFVWRSLRPAYAPAMLLRPRVCRTTHAWLLRLGFGLVLSLAFRAAPPARAADTHPTQERADRFLSLVNASYQALAYVESEAQWKAATDVTPAHDASAATAGKARAAFVGNPALIQETKQLLLLRRELTDLSVRQRKCAAF